MREGIVTGNATFRPWPSGKEWASSHGGTCRLVAKEIAMLLSAALPPVSAPCINAREAEVNVRAEPEQSVKGIGLALLKELITFERGGRGMYITSRFISKEYQQSSHR